MSVRVAHLTGARRCVVPVGAEVLVAGRPRHPTPSTGVSGGAGLVAETDPIGDVEVHAREPLGRFGPGP